MRKYRKVLKDEIKDVICDICEQSCMTECSLNDPGMSEYAVLEGIWGYCSSRDGDRYVCEMCERCFKKVSDFISSMKKTPGCS